MARTEYINGITKPKVYRALLTQTGTDAPVATVLENTLGFVPTWTRGGVGLYSFTTALNELPLDKTFVTATIGTQTSGFIVHGACTGDYLELFVYDDTWATVELDSFNPQIGVYLEVLVYP